MCVSSVANHGTERTRASRSAYYQFVARMRLLGPLVPTVTSQASIMRICSQAKTLSRWLEAGVHSGALLLLLLTALAQAQDFTYTKTNGAITITGGNVSGNVVIPNSIVGLPVVAIGDFAFYNDSLSGIAVP